MLSFKEETFFNITIVLSYLILFGSYFGLTILAPHNLSKFETYMQLYICVSLLIRFNPLRNARFSNLDRKIAFSAGLLLLSSTILNSYKLKLLHFMETHIINKKRIKDKIQIIL